jgi:hypothetical protein
MTRYSALACFACASMVACTDVVLEPILDGGGSPGGPDGTPVDATGPVLIYAHDAGIRAYVELQDQVPPSVNDAGFDYFAEKTPVAAGLVGYDLVIASDDGPGEVTLLRFADFALGGNPTVSTKTLTINPTTLGKPQRVVEVRGDASGSLWMRSAQELYNFLAWSPSGSLEGPWVVFQAPHSIIRWALLPDQQTIVASNPGEPAYLLHVDRMAQQISLDASQTGNHGYIAFEVFGGALYALNFGCEDGGDCSDTGELHIWRDLDNLDLLAPTAIVPIPNTASHVCSITVNANALAVGTCNFNVGTEPRLHVFENPEQLVDGAQPDQTFELADGPWRLASHGWHDDTHQRTVSIYMHGLGETLYVFENEGGGPLQATELATEPSFVQGRALLIVP